MDKVKQEQRGIYNVTFGDERVAPIFKDIEVIEDAVIEYVAMYVKGYHNIKRDIGLGAEHIKMHLDKGADGEITLEELLNLGKSMRGYLKTFREPFIDDKGAKIYEWENAEKIRFRAVVSKITEGYLSKAHQRGGSQPPLSPSDDIIITFYSDRNLNKQMEFKNLKVEAYYQQQSQEKPLQEKKKIFSKNPKPTQETRDKLNKKIKALSNKIKIDKDCSNKMSDRDR